MPLMYYPGIHSSLHDIHLNPLFVDEFFQPDKVEPGLLQQYFSFADPNVRFLVRHLTACAMMSEVYHLLPGAEISTAVLKTCLAAAKWVHEATETPDSAGLNISQAFACIAMLNSGTCNLAPESLSHVFALSSGNSLYILASLLCDPFERPHASEIRRVVGNVGRPGMTFLISPPEVKTREADPGQWMAINHSAFDGQPANHFGNTSIHLSFTNYKNPLIPDENHQHLIDRVFVLVETLVSVFDGQAWVGEVDILKTFNHHVIQRAVNDQFCSHAERGVSYEAVVRKFSRLAATSIENWDELIEAPASGTIVAKRIKVGLPGSRLRPWL
ncbi:hypothetical protein HYALB_00007776 [Hymenoscyphus albidus]|uniref:Uncharacterized protein n=1 Tax=Hymenoscyphus albidus TaxID=595503 RepID=A0A9N9PWF7_9HELO|nr:hypothetical protein HYALB_00007776 [Hymenoscyphus albidus]